MRIKTIAGILIVLFFTAVSGYTQGYQPPSADDIITKMKGELNLTDEQVSQIKPIIENEIQQQQAIKEQAKSQGTDRETVKSQLQTLRNDTESKLSQYLSQDKMTQWRDDQKRRERLNGDPNSDSGSAGQGRKSGHHRHLNVGNDW